MGLETQEWLEVVRREYLEDFIRGGGAAVKFVVPADATSRLEVRDGLRRVAEGAGFQFTFVDAVATKLHLIDKLFHDVARQVDWYALARAFLTRRLPEMGYRLPAEPEAFTLDTIAAVNDFDTPFFLTEVKRGLWQQLSHEYAMSREFRMAMFRLCLAQLDPSDDPTLREAVLQWLHGELRLISAVKRALIFQRIARHNARHMLFSLAHWTRLAGKSGLVLGLDITRYADATRPAERGSGLYYSTTAVIDAYEVLRQLIDATDELAFCFAGILASPEFLTDDRRGLQRYQALYLRISDEVRDRYRPNPRSSLVRLAATAPAVPSSGFRVSGSELEHADGDT
ncbi:MAG: BREX system ATP-binding domain-containing protein [Chloroflexota bacterium]